MGFTYTYNSSYNLRALIIEIHTRFFNSLSVLIWLSNHNENTVLDGNLKIVHEFPINS